MTTYISVTDTPIKHDCVEYKKGETIKDLTAKDAKVLLAAGYIEAVIGTNQDQDLTPQDENPVDPYVEAEIKKLVKDNKLEELQAIAVESNIEFDENATKKELATKIALEGVK